MKKTFQRQFMDQSNIDYWESIYEKHNFSGDCYRERMNTVLSWIEELNLLDKPIILEAGCGAGRFAREAARRGYAVFGMDYSYGMALNASSISGRENPIDIAFLQGDIESLPLQDSSFDVIVCLGVVAYLKSEEKAVQELARALKPGGVLAISIVNKARFVYRLDLPLLFISILTKILNRITGSWKKDTDFKDDSSLTTYYIPKFQKSLEAAGFKVLEYKTVPWKLLTFFGKEVFPQKMAVKITLFFEKFSKIPVVGSFGGMCIFKAEKNSF